MDTDDRAILEKLSFVMAVDTGMMNSDQMDALARNRLYAHRMKKAKLRYLAQLAIKSDQEIQNAQKEEEEEVDPSKPFKYKILSNAKSQISKAYTKITKGDMTTNDIRKLISDLQSMIKK